MVRIVNRPLIIGQSSLTRRKALSGDELPLLDPITHPLNLFEIGAGVDLLLSAIIGGGLSGYAALR